MTVALLQMWVGWQRTRGQEFPVSSDKKNRRHCWQAMRTFGNNQCQWVVLSAGQIGLEKIMTRLAPIGLAAALLLGGATFPREDIHQRGGTRIFMATTPTRIVIMLTILATTPTILSIPPSRATGTTTALAGRGEVTTRSQLVERCAIAPAAWRCWPQSAALRHSLPTPARP